MADTSSGVDLLPFEQACEDFQFAFPVISKARLEADESLIKLRNSLDKAQLRLDDTTLSLVVFGSIARREWTSGSDIDWTLLVDGPVDPEHFQLAISIREALQADGFQKPGDTGTFGTLASSHDLVHRVGGLNDTNENMTRRLLLLLESKAVVNPEVRDRVLKSILNRYIVCGRGIREESASSFRVPRFLLNDAVRYWRTIAVDYAAKKWEQANKKWALRNAKLRVPRKIIFAKGLLLSFDCELFCSIPPWSDLTIK